jgi:hypothetical protein
LPENQASDKKWLEKHGPDAVAWTPAAGTGRVAPTRRGVKPTWSRYVSRDKGLRVAPDGEKKKTRPDHFEALQVSIGKWARAEQLAGNELAADDLFDEYVSRLEDEKAKLQDPAASLSEKDKGWLKHVLGRLEAVKQAHNRRQHRKRLVFKTGFHERAPGNVMPLTTAEADLICLLSWQSF